jgi:lysophospholipase L1-like esterase
MELMLRLLVLCAWQQPGAPLPRVLLIGDSISIGYTPIVRETLRGIAEVERPPVNCGSSGRGVQEIDKWVGDGHWDVIHFNFGLHDAVKSANPEAHVRQYVDNLRKILARLEKTGAKLIWANTTPLPGEVMKRDGQPAKYQKDVLALNAAARTLMEERGIAIDDLYSFALPRRQQLQIEGDMHFTEAGSRQLGLEVASSIRASLSSSKHAH